MMFGMMTKKQQAKFDQEHRWYALARYNSERSRGLMHTAEWHAKMRREQEVFDAERLADQT